MNDPLVIRPRALFDAKQLAAALGVDERTARRLFLVEREILRPALIGRKHYVLGSDVLRFIEARRASA